MGNIPTVWTLDLGNGSIGKAGRPCGKFPHKSPSTLLAISGETKKGLKLSLASVQELRLIASLLSSRQFGILATAGFDLDAMENLFN